MEMSDAGKGDWLLQGSSHPVRLYVDGALVTESTLRYPRTIEPYTVSYIASNVRMEVRVILFTCMCIA